MPKKEFMLGGNSNKGPFNQDQLTLEWKGNYKNMSVVYNGKNLGVIADQKELKQGRTFTLPDNGMLSISLESGFFSGAKLNILHDGKPVAGAGNDPAQAWKSAYQIIYFVGGLSMALGIGAEVLQIEFLIQIGANIFMAVFGFIFLILGYMVSSEKSVTALYLAIVLYGLDALSLIVFSAAAGGRPSFGGVIVHIFFIMQMMKGIPALQQLREQEAAQQYRAY